MTIKKYCVRIDITTANVVIESTLKNKQYNENQIKRLYQEMVQPSIKTKVNSHGVSHEKKNFKQEFDSGSG